jgi:homocysteine S-methyltransferase
VRAFSPVRPHRSAGHALPDRDRLPQLFAERPFVTDGGLETTLIFHRGLVLPDFAAFVLLQDATGRQALHDYYLPHLAIAREQGLGLVLDTPPGGRTPPGRPASATRSRSWTRRTGRRWPLSTTSTRASPPAARRSSSPAPSALRATAGFTVEIDGRLPDGTRLRDAIDEVDAATDGAAAYFMVNCAHPTHFADVLDEDGPWLERIGAIRANASTRSHAELDEAEDLDDGDPVRLGADHLALRPRLPRVRVLGGCCGTDHRHVAEVITAWQS